MLIDVFYIPATRHSVPGGRFRMAPMAQSLTFASSASVPGPKRTGVRLP